MLKIEKIKHDTGVENQIMLHTKRHTNELQLNVIQSNELEGNKPVVVNNVERPQRTTPIIPFSFYHRDELLSIKKKETIKKVIENEKINREFHANPLPKFIEKNRGSNNTIDSCGSSNSISKREVGISIPFKARPPTVLYQEPFIPEIVPKQHLAFKEIKLSTTARMEERSKFNKMLKVREETLKLILANEEKKRQKIENEEISRLRKEAEHKAQPIKKYKPVNIQYHHQVTEPITPKCLSRSKQ